MKKKSDSRSAFVNSRLLIGFIVFLAGTLLAVFVNAFAQPGSAKPGLKVPQRHNVKTDVQQPDQNFWAQTNGPQGGDGIALASNSSGQLFVGTQGGGVFRSTDNGEAWTGVNNGLTATNVRALAINAATGHIFAGTFGGAFRSTDDANTWVQVNNGLIATFVLTIAINPPGDRIPGPIESDADYRFTDTG